MFIPIGDEPNPKKTPIVTYGFMAVNIIIFILLSLPLMHQNAATMSSSSLEYLRQLANSNNDISFNQLLRFTNAYDVFIFHWGYKPALPSMTTLFASMFLHGGWMHLIGNMLFLWIFGDNVENHLGRVKYFFSYIATGIFATLFYSLFQTNSEVPLIGASGAISGILAFYYMWFPRNRVKVIMVLFVFIQIIYLPARWVLGFYLIADNLLPFLLNANSSGGVAHGAHIGGFVAGLMMIKLFEWWESNRNEFNSFFQTYRQSNGSKTDHVGGDRSSTSFKNRLKHAEWNKAFEIYSSMTKNEQNLLDDWDLLKLTDGLTQLNNNSASIAILLRFISTRPTSTILPLAHLRVGLINLRVFNKIPAAYQHLLAVLDLNPPIKVEKTARMALEEIEKIQHQKKS